MSYEDAIKQQEKREAQQKFTAPEESEEIDYEDNKGVIDEDEEDFDYSILGSLNHYDLENKPQVNGTESQSMSDD